MNTLKEAKKLLCKRIIPCLDVNKGRVVKGTNFVDLKDAGDPIELAQRYNQEGADELVFLDITASSDKREILIDWVQKTAAEIFIPFTVGGGIQDIESIHALLRAGADKVSINTAAVKDPGFVEKASQHFGSQCIVAAIDAKAIQSPSGMIPSHLPETVWLDEGSGWEIFTHGGRNATGIDAVKWAAYLNALGAGELLVTSMDRDGTKAGYDIALLSAIKAVSSCPVIASGGAGSTDHIVEALKTVDAALLASLLHYQITSVSEIKTACIQHDICVRET